MEKNCPIWKPVLPGTFSCCVPPFGTLSRPHRNALPRRPSAAINNSYCQRSLRARQPWKECAEKMWPTAILTAATPSPPAGNKRHQPPPTIHRRDAQEDSGTKTATAGHSQPETRHGAAVDRLRNSAAATGPIAWRARVRRTAPPPLDRPVSARLASFVDGSTAD